LNTANLLKLKRKSSNSSHSIYKKNKQIEEIDKDLTEEKRISLVKQNSSNLIKRKSQFHEETAENTPRNSEKAWIGPLSRNERLEKVRRYFLKKGMKSSMKKFCYKCRK
jgi:hypothetical protein